MKNKVPVALGKKTPKDLSKNVSTTQGFGRFDVCYFRETFPNQDYKIKPSMFSFASPSALPNMSNISSRLHGFYVPYRFVWRHWDSFINGQFCQPFNDVIPFAPYFTLRDFCNILSDTEFVEPYLFSDGTLQAALNNSDSPVSIDLISGDLNVRSWDSGYNPEIVGVHLRPLGKMFYNLLNALGYNLPFFHFVIINKQYTNSSGQTVSGAQILKDEYNIDLDEKFSILPLLSYLKVYYDYIIPNQLIHSTPLENLFNTINNANTESSLHIPLHIVMSCLEWCFNYYSSNYFTSQWLSPNSPTGSIDNPYINYTIVDNNTNLQDDSGSPESTSTHVAVHYMSDYNYAQTSANGVSDQQLTLLQRFSRFIKRNLLTGKRNVDILASRFGVHVDDFEYGRSMYLGSMDTPLKKDIVNGTSSENLAEYAGQSRFSMPEGKTFTIESKFHGCIIFLCSLSLPSVYIDGMRRHVKHLHQLDFFTPEFDGSNFQATYGSELLNRLPVTTPALLVYKSKARLNSSDIYGFSPRYSEMKTEIDDVLNDFTLPSRARTIDGFILPRRLINQNDYYSRLLVAIKDGLLNVINDTLFNSLHSNEQYLKLYDDGSPDGQVRVTPLDVMRQDDAWQFNRIFMDIYGAEDPFFTQYHFDVMVYDGSLPFDEVHELVGKGKDLYYESDGVNIN